MTVSVNEKRTFLKWILNNYAMKQREAVWILNYFASHDHNMERLHFVEKSLAIGHNAFSISTTCVKEAPFAMLIKEELTTDAERCFHHIRRSLANDEHFYIEVNFKNSLYSPQYAGVLEDNPKLKDVKIHNNITDNAKKFINEMERRNVLHLIDLALDAKDQERFNYLVGGLNK